MVRRLQSDLLKAHIDRLGHPALAFALRRAGAAPARRLATAPPVGRSAGGPVFLGEGATKPLQLPDQSCALRAEFVGGRIVVPARCLVFFEVIDRSHVQIGSATQACSAGAARRTCLW